MRDFEIVPTVVPQSFDDIVKARARYAFAPCMHIDIADGSFAPNRTWNVGPLEKLPEVETTEYEVHLMVDTPLQGGFAFARAGAVRIIAHVESFDNAECAREAFTMWRQAGIRDISIALRLETPLEDARMYIDLCDGIHVMTIASVGKQGIPFDDRSLQRIRFLHEKYPDTEISVDGGASRQTLPLLKEAGARRICVGSALNSAKNPQAEYAALLKMLRDTV